MAGARIGIEAEDQDIVDPSRDSTDPRAPEDSAIFELTCPRCGTRIPTARQLPLDREPPRETVSCPSCGYDIRLLSDPTLT